MDQMHLNQTILDISEDIPPHQFPDGLKDIDAEKDLVDHFRRINHGEDSFDSIVNYSKQLNLFENEELEIGEIHDK